MGEWFKTGDYVSVNKSTGAFRILGRISQDIIKKAGFKISALDIESQIFEMGSEKISEVCVLGIPDSKYGEQIVCIYAGSANAAEIEKYLEKHLSQYKIPKTFIQTTALERNQMGKVSKKQVLAKYFT